MKLAKRSIALLLAFMLIFGCFPNSVFATESTATITVGSLAEVTVGQTVTVPVTISNNPGFTYAYLKIGYDANALELQGVSANLSGIKAKLGNNNGLVELSAQDDYVDVTGNDVLFTMTFKAVKAGKADVSLSCKNNDAGNITNAEEKAVPMSFKNGSVTVKAAGSCINVNESILPAGGWTMTVGDNETIDLSKLFTDADGHTLVYGFNVIDSNGQKHISWTHMSTNPATPGVLTFSTPDADRYTITVSATCEETGEKKEATISATVKAAEDGLPVQYGYEQTDKDKVKVFVTVSSDGIPLQGNDGTILSHLEITVPYFDLAEYGLEDYYRLESDDSGDYVGDVIKRPTAMHLFIYLIQRYYMGLPEEYCGPGGGEYKDYYGTPTNPVDYQGTNGTVYNMYGGEAYQVYDTALYCTGSAQSIYMENVWGHYGSPMYYRNHAYPLKPSGYGVTADYILLSDGDTIDMALSTNVNFYQYGSFCTYVNRKTESDDGEINGNFTDVNYRPDTAFSATVGEKMILSAVKFETQGGIDDFVLEDTLNTKLYDEDWNEVTDDDTATFEDDLKGHYTLKFKSAGTYYLLGLDSSAGTEYACVAPATAKIVVTEATPTHEHSLTKHAANDATCTEAGNTAYWSCDACGKYFSDAAGTTEIQVNSWEVAAKGHTMTKNDAVDATCTEAGNTAYWSCDVCGKYFSDEEGTTEIQADSLIIPKKVHEMTKTDAVAATCEAGGNNEYYTCGTCSKVFKDAEGKEETTVAAETLKARGHDKVQHGAKAATCTEKGWEAYETCSRCGYTTYNEVAAKGHTLIPHAAVEATETKAGNTAYWSCECGKYFSDAEGTTEIQVNSWIIPKKGQTPVTPVTPATPATPATPYTYDYMKEEDSEKWTTPEDKGSVPTVTKGADGSVTAQATAEVMVTGGTAKATVDSKTATELVKQANDNKATEVKLEVKAADTKDAKAIQAELPKSALSDIAGKTDAALVLATPQGEVKLDNKVLDEIAKAAAETNVTIEIKAAAPTLEQTNTIGKSAQVIELTITSGSKTIGEFNGGTATFASELPKALDGKRAAAVCIKADGTLEVLPSKVIEVSGKKHIEFTTSHFSTFAIVDADEAGIEEEQVAQAEKKNEKLIAGVNATKMTAKSSITKNSKGKKAIKISWTQSKGYKVDYYEVWKSTKKNSGYKKLYTTVDSNKKSLVTSKNLKKGKTYYFKVRGVRMIDGKKYYTKWSSKVSKTYK